MIGLFVVVFGLVVVEAEPFLVIVVSGRFLVVVDCFEVVGGRFVVVTPGITFGFLTVVGFIVVSGRFCPFCGLFGT